MSIAQDTIHITYRRSGVDAIPYTIKLSVPKEQNAFGLEHNQEVAIGPEKAYAFLKTHWKFLDKYYAEGEVYVKHFFNYAHQHLMCNTAKLRKELMELPEVIKEPTSLDLAEWGEITPVDEITHTLALRKQYLLDKGNRVVLIIQRCDEQYIKRDVFPVPYSWSGRGVVSFKQLIRYLQQGLSKKDIYAGMFVTEEQLNELIESFGGLRKIKAAK